MELYRRLDVPTKTNWSFSSVITDWEAGGYGPSYVNGHPNNLISVTDSRFHLHQDSPYEHSGEILLTSDGLFKIVYEFGPDKGGWPSSDQDFGFYVRYNDTGLGGFAGGGYWWPDTYICFEKDNNTQKARMITFKNTGRWPDETSNGTTRWNAQLYSILEGLYPNYQAINYITGNSNVYNLSKLIDINAAEPVSNAPSSSVNLNNASRIDSLIQNR